MIILAVMIVGVMVVVVMRYHYAISQYKTRFSHPRGFPFLGNIDCLDTGVILEKLHDLRVKYNGNWFELWALGRRMLVVSDPAIQREIMTKRPKIFRRTALIEKAFDDLGLVTAIFAAEGSQWSRLRRLTAPVFNSTHLSNMTTDIAAEAAVMVSRFTTYAGESSAMGNCPNCVNVDQEMMHFTVNVIMRVALGRLDGIDERMRNYCGSKQMFADTNSMFAYLMSRTIHPFPDWTKGFFPQLKRELQAGLESVDRMGELVQAIIEREQRRRADRSSSNVSTEGCGLSSTNKSVVQVLMDASESTGCMKEMLTEEEIVHNVMLFLLAGSETTGVSISWSLYFLSLPQHKQLLQSIRDECDAVFRYDSERGEKEFARHVSENFASSNLPLTRACLKESIRLLGPATFLIFDNKAGQPVKLSDGTVVEPSDQVICFVEGPCVDNRVYAHADAFDPHRWITPSACSDTVGTMEDAFLGFGAGSRVCPGMNLAFMEGTVALATLVCNFDFQLACRPDEVKRVLKFSAKPDHLPMLFWHRA